MAPSSKGKDSWQDEIRGVAYFVGVVLTCGGFLAIAERIWGLRYVSDIVDTLLCLVVLKKAFDWRNHLWKKRGPH
jgi:hypothetical protein